MGASRVLFVPEVALKKWYQSFTDVFFLHHMCRIEAGDIALRPCALGSSLGERPASGSAITRRLIQTAIAPNTIVPPICPMRTPSAPRVMLPRVLRPQLTHVEYPAWLKLLNAALETNTIPKNTEPSATGPAYSKSRASQPPHLSRAGPSHV